MEEEKGDSKMIEFSVSNSNEDNATDNITETEVIKEFQLGQKVEIKSIKIES